jgi:iron complex outermembrane receptor protein
VIDNQLQSKWNWGETQHTVLLGVDHMGVKQDNRDGSGSSPTLFDLYDPVYGNVPESELAVAVDQPDQRIRQTGVYLQDQIRVGEHWTFTAGIRNDRVIDKTEGGDEQIDTAFSKRFGVVYLAENGIAPYFSYSESFNPVVGLDAQGQSFKPRRGKQTEVGLRYQPPNTDSMYMVSIYDLEEENRLSGDPDNPNFSVQKGKAKVWGVELDAVASLTSKLDLIANYTYTHARTEDNTGESYVAEVHPHVASLWTTYRFSIGDHTGFKVGGGARFIGSNRDETGTLDVPSVTLFDAMLAYEADDWKASINALNITDETYIASCLSRGDCWYGSRARAVASVTFKF